MMVIDEQDLYDVLYHLTEAKGSIGAMSDLLDEKTSSALMEDRRRIDAAISMILNAIRENRQRSAMRKLEGNADATRVPS